MGYIFHNFKRNAISNNSILGEKNRQMGESEKNNDVILNFFCSRCSFVLNGLSTILQTNHF